MDLSLEGQIDACSRWCDSYCDGGLPCSPSPMALPILESDLLSTYLCRVAHFYPEVISYTPVFKEKKVTFLFS